LGNVARTIRGFHTRTNLQRLGRGGRARGRGGGGGALLVVLGAALVLLGF
jgi:hypothetical protein